MSMKTEGAESQWSKAERFFYFDLLMTIPRTVAMTADRDAGGCSRGLMRKLFC